MSTNKLWLIKNKNKRVRGPLNTDDIIQMIRDNVLTGEEWIAEYPSGKWKPISVEPLFYDHLIDLLSDTPVESIDSSKGGMPPTPSDPSQDKKTQNTVILDPDDIKILKQRTLNKKPSSRSQKSPRKNQEKTVIYTTKPLHDTSSTTKNPDAILSTQAKQEQKSFFLRIPKGIIFLLITGIFIFVLLYPPSQPTMHTEFVTLTMPRGNQPAIAKDKIHQLTKKGFLQYLKSSFSSYLKSQVLLVQAVEGDLRNAQAMAFLCLVYLELWPFSKQDFKTRQTITNIVHKTSTLNKGGVRFGLCQSVSFLIKENYQHAKATIESSLNGLTTTKTQEEQVLLPIFYYLKALSLYYMQDYSTINNYLDTVQKMLPNWIKPKLLAGKILLQKKQVNSALSTYKKVLQLQPNHKQALIQVGLIEYRHFKKIDKALNLLNKALDNPDKISHAILSDAYLGLAEIHLKQNNPSTALTYARKAYSYNPINEASRNLVVQIGGLKKLKQTKVKSNQLIYQADQLVRENNPQQAVGYYEEAFKMSDKKNAMVAIKLAKTLWQLNFHTEAMEWIKKAIEADPYMMESYILMSEYYAEQYDFHNATKILKLAVKKSPRNYEIYKGWAYLNLKREDYKQAILAAEQAVKLYETDVESFHILSKAYGKLGKINESLSAATRAKELDPSSVQTQVIYARALGGMYGADTGLHYFQQLQDNYPEILQYKMETVKYLFDEEKYKKARILLNKILHFQPKHSSAHFYLGRILTFEGDYRGAYEAFLQAAIISPSDPKPTFYIGKLRLKEKKYELAKQQFTKALALNKFYPQIHYYLGRIAFLQRDYTTAIEEARLETKINPYLLDPFLLAGESYEQINDFDNCAKEYQKASEIQPENMNLYVKIARCYRKLGLLDLATVILTKAGGDDNTETRSGDPQLYKELGVIYEMKGNLLEASESYCNYLNLMPKAPDRQVIKQKMQNLTRKTGKKLKNCG